VLVSVGCSKNHVQVLLLEATQCIKHHIGVT
jgi:hypothetical protein